MRTFTSRRRGIALAAASAVAASTLLGLQGPATAAAPTPPHGTTVDYFDDVYPNLEADSVFETVTFERFEYILKSKPGNFAFLIGDPGDASTQATIGHIDAVAKEQGIERIYNFTPKLDGDTLNVWDLAESNLRTGTATDVSGGNRAGSGLAQFETAGQGLLDNYLNQDTTPQFTKNAATDPYLFVYNKDRTVGAAQDRIVASLTGAKTAADLDTTPEVDTYKAAVADVLDVVDDYETNTQFEFNRDEHNRRHWDRYVEDEKPETDEAEMRARFGGDILDATDAEDGFRVETITYPELKNILDKSGDFAFLFGGTWCHNTAAIIKDTNALAQKHGIKKVYNFDFAVTGFSNGGNEAPHIRDNARVDPETGKVIRPSHLYGDLVNDYLTNAVTQYKKTDDPGAGGPNFVQYYPGGDTTLAPQEARKIQVGHVLSYNKDRKDALGNRAPVVDQAIRHNDDGGNTEHMTEWWFVSGRDLPAGEQALRGAANPASEAGSNGLQNQRAFAKEAIDEIDTVLAGVGKKSVASTTSVAVASSVRIGTAPTVTVSVNAAGYNPFISLNTANANTAPVSATGKPRGFVALFDGDKQVGDLVRLGRNGTASVTLPAQTTLGAKSYTLDYLGRGDAIGASKATFGFTVTKPSSVITAAASTATYGKPGVVNIATTGPDGYVPSGLVRVTVGGATYTAALDAQGRAAVATPKTLLPKKYAVTVIHEGDATVRAASSTTTLTVAKGSASAPKLAAKGTLKASKKGKATVTVKTPTGLTKAGGKVTIVLTKGKVKKTITKSLSSGKATVTLPKLAKGTWKAKVTYRGDTRYNASKAVNAKLKVKK